jgi:hypothetical protein
LAAVITATVNKLFVPTSLDECDAGIYRLGSTVFVAICCYHCSTLSFFY